MLLPDLMSDAIARMDPVRAPAALRMEVPRGDLLACSPEPQEFTAPPMDHVNKIEVQKVPVFAANPVPTGQTGSIKPVVSRGQEGIVTTNPPAQQEEPEVAQPKTAPVPEPESLDNIKDPGPTIMTTGPGGKETQVITGDNLQSPVSGQRDGVNTPHGAVAYQGMDDSALTVTIDHIVRSDFDTAVKYINKCTDVNTLKVSKMTLRNQNKGKLLDRVERRLVYLQQRGY